MLKKPTIVSVLFVIIAFALLSAAMKPGNKMRILSKKSHAEKLWETSGHADTTAEAFTHWDEDTPAEIPTSCAKCHSTPGFLDFLDNGVVDSAAEIGTTVECAVCHTNEETGILRDHTSVTFPSGALAENLGPETLCMECHQGRESTTSVDAHITAAGVPDDDTISTKLRFRNIHYFAAAASQFGTVAKGGYEYSGKSYDARFSHVTGYNACITCHNPHSLEVELEACTTCHTNPNDPKNITFPGSFFAGVKDTKDIRFYGSFVDYDGDGNIKEGIYYEIQGVLKKLYAIIQTYAKNVAGTSIVYDASAYPYWFKDTNDNGTPDPDEIVSANGYRSFTARLVRATYNFQFTKKDPAGFAHGGKYIIELLYDSMEDLNSQLTVPVSMAGMSRIDEGHFDGSAEAWRHWDGGGEVSASCAKCHSAKGLPYSIENGENVAAEISNGLLCTTCHTSPPSIRKQAAVTFPSGAVATMGDNSNICLNCHQGRESKKSVDDTIAASGGPYSFKNIHYFPVGVVLFGSEAHGGYEYDGKTYVGRKIWANHNGRFNTCIECHMGTKSIRKIVSAGQENMFTIHPGLSSSSIKQTPNQKSKFLNRMRRIIGKNNSVDTQTNDTYGDHNVHKPNPADCVYCHGQDISQPNPGADPAKFKFSGIRPASIPDYDAEGNTAESLEEEINGLENALYAQIWTYSATTLFPPQPIVYDGHSYPYWFKDTNGNGQIDPGENISANRFTKFDAKLLKAAFNYQLSQKEPHAFIHNSRYIAQLLVDSIQNLGGNVSAYTWR